MKTLYRFRFALGVAFFFITAIIVDGGCTCARS